MPMMLATWKQGRFVPDGKIDLPEGTRVRMVEENDAEPKLYDFEINGLTEENYPTTPEGLKRMLEWMDEVPPLIFTEEEQVRMAQVRKEDREWELSQFDEHGDKLRKMFE